MNFKNLKKKSDKHNCCVSSACVDGRCPRALARDNLTRDDDVLMIYEGDKNLKCSHCYYRSYECKDCIFKDTEYCDEVNE